MTRTDASRGATCTVRSRRRVERVGGVLSTRATTPETRHRSTPITRHARGNKTYVTDASSREFHFMPRVSPRPRRSPRAIRGRSCRAPGGRAAEGEGSARFGSDAERRVSRAGDRRYIRRGSTKSSHGACSRVRIVPTARASEGGAFPAARQAGRATHVTRAHLEHVQLLVQLHRGAREVGPEGRPVGRSPHHRRRGRGPTRAARPRLVR